MIRTGALHCRRGVVFALPGLWVLAVVVWGLVSPLGPQLVPLVAAAPAIACAGTGRRQCAVLGCCCALVAVLPPGPYGRSGPGDRLGTCCAILAVVGAGYLTSGRGRRLTAELERAKEVALTAQHALLRPLPPRLDGLTLAGGHLSASEGALVGGDLYDAQATPHGVRIVMGDVRGHGLPALGTVAALLGSFREAAHDEPGLPGVLRRLERALHRHLRDRVRTGQPGGADAAERERADAEEFVTVLLLEIRASGEVMALNCGHPWPHRLTHGAADRPCAVAATCGEPLPPLGMFPLPAELSPLALTRLHHGDTLVLHTDGAEDARDAAGTFFPLTGALTEAAHGAAVTPAGVVEHVRDALLSHTRGQLSDDFALLVLRNDREYLPAQAPPAPLVRSCLRS
ncbi:PP2C family protein-serine/threonine phosphatase [Streptomyces sp. NPDC026206]|uniref:PP2C family protein-serine/threonine phosphatase n=1 Tax=Streptomyces sp. NPDC026206 TaxID=3157089 RepID=UPI0034005D7B